MGENLPVDAALYIDANKKALTYTSINLSDVNAMKTGTYEADTSLYRWSNSETPKKAPSKNTAKIFKTIGSKSLMIRPICSK